MLDASTRIDVLNLLVGLKARGLSVLFITHDLSLGYYISERAAILYQGCIVEMGSTDKIYYNPLHPYTKMLMASVPRLDMKWEEEGVSPAAALTARQSDLDRGCVYHERCSLASKCAACAQTRPTLAEIEPDHSVACHCAAG